MACIDDYMSFDELHGMTRILVKKEIVALDKSGNFNQLIDIYDDLAELDILKVSGDSIVNYNIEKLYFSPIDENMEDLFASIIDDYQLAFTKGISVDLRIGDNSIFSRDLDLNPQSFKLINDEIKDGIDKISTGFTNVYDNSINHKSTKNIIYSFNFSKTNAEIVNPYPGSFFFPITNGQYSIDDLSIIQDKFLKISKFLDIKYKGLVKLLITVQSQIIYCQICKSESIDIPYTREITGKSIFLNKIRIRPLYKCVNPNLPHSTNMYPTYADYIHNFENQTPQQIFEPVPKQSKYKKILMFVYRIINPFSLLKRR